jgi:hypothetical protein
VRGEIGFRVKIRERVHCLTKIGRRKDLRKIRSGKERKKDSGSGGVFRGVRERNSGGGLKEEEKRIRGRVSKRREWVKGESVGVGRGSEGGKNRGGECRGRSGE